MNFSKTNQEVIETSILPLVQKPGRYLGNELNSIHKDWNATPLKMALAFPDLYEIGMSNLAVQIIYHIINSDPDCLCERVFIPYPDFSAKIKEHKVPLVSLENFKPLSEFDLIGFSIGYELNFSNIVAMLQDAGIPALRTDREKLRLSGQKVPLVFAGGMSIANPEPIVDFFDFFLFGEAEDALPQITAEAKQQLQNKDFSNARTCFLQAITKLPGIFVPELDQADGKPARKISRAFVKDYNNAPFPTKPIVPFIETVHDRAAIEIMRGCPWRCKFCLSGATEKPVRMRSAQKVLELAEESIKNSGYEEVSLLSLSTSDYPYLEQVARELTARFAEKRISISLPSMRVNSFSIKVAKEILKVRQTTVTLAPEAGTQRLREVIDKRITEEDIIGGVGTALQEGVNNIKLYFMIGLPTETEADLAGICDLGEKVIALGRGANRAGGGRAKIHVGLSTFIPKPHTPFERERQISIQETLGKQAYLKQHLNRKIEIRWHDAKSSYLEGVFSRGDRKLAPVLLRAVELGCRLDAWTEHFQFEKWLQAFMDCGIDPNQYLFARPEPQQLPWDYLEPWNAKD